MPKYMFLYKGEATDLSEMSEEDAAKVAAGWGAWIGRVGPALADVGTPLAPGTSVIDDGGSGAPVKLSGYSIVEAEDLSAAEALTAGHPFLSEGKGDYAIDVFEMLPVPEM